MSGLKTTPFTMRARLAEGLYGKKAWQLTTRESEVVEGCIRKTVGPTKVKPLKKASSRGEKAAKAMYGRSFSDLNDDEHITVVRYFKAMRRN